MFNKAGIFPSREVTNDRRKMHQRKNQAPGSRSCPFHLHDDSHALCCTALGAPGAGRVQGGGGGGGGSGGGGGGSDVENGEENMQYLATVNPDGTGAKRVSSGYFLIVAPRCSQATGAIRVHRSG